jgi:flagellar biosynthetic protein FliP
MRALIRSPRTMGGRAALFIGLLAFFILFAMPALAQGAAPAAAPPPVTAPAAAPGVGDAVDRALGDLGGGEAPLSMSLQVLIIMGLLTVLPGIMLMMTSFTRIIIVLAILRQALGLQQTPPNQVLIGLSMFLTFFVMAPSLDTMNTQAIQPYAAGRITSTQLIETTGKSFHAFMLKQTRQKDVKMFADMAKSGPYARPEDVPFSVLLPAFVTSELKTAFQIGFLIFLPFLVIDLVVATVLMSLGMMMMSPTIISLPFKLLLFVLVDGWALTMGSLAASFAT